MEQKHKSIKKNFFYNILLNATNLLAPLISMPYVLRILGPEGIGKVNVAMSLMGYFLLIVQIGTNVYGIKEIAKVRDDPKKLNKVFSELFTINAAMTFMSLLIYLGIVASVGKFRGDIVLYLVVGINIAVNVFSIDWFYGGLEEYKYLTLRNLAVKVVYIALVFIIIHAQGDYIKYALLGAGVIVAGNLINMVYLFEKIRFSFGYMDLARHLKAISMIFLTGVIASVAAKMDVVLLGVMTGPKYVGYYSTGRAITGIAFIFVSSLGTVLMPRLAYYLHAGMKDEYNRMAEKSVNFIYFASLPIIALIVLLSDEIIQVFAGSKFLEASMPMKILSFQILANGMSLFLGYQVMLAHNDERSMVLTAIPGLVINMAINLLFIKRYYQLAPSVATVLAETAVVITQLIMAAKYMRFRMFKRQSAAYFIASAALFAALFFIRPLLHLPHFAVIFICTAVFLSLYAGYLFLAKDENITIILNLALKRLGKASL